MKRAFILLFVYNNLLFMACQNSRSDEKIQLDINDMFKKDMAGAALNATVDSGTATITGQCIGSGCKADIIEKVKKVNGVKDVQTNILEK